MNNIKNNINNINLQPGLNGLPPVKARSSDYEEQEKIEIAKAAREYGVNAVAKAYGVKWQSVAAWMKKKQGNMKSNIETKIIVQSPAGQEITVKEIKEKIKALEAIGAVGTVGTAGTIDAAYVRADENAIYWVRGEENGSIRLWE